ncbi:hypothetical protein LCGC14_2975890 [marine sediment metagenome]|uniref:Uncharacterized protein n=1 Tax=marine sediment metagenome TaxID=412755 RepID=A0A0F8ZFM1_9ZZZZ
MNWDIKTVRSGEEGKLLEQGYEPFGVSPHDTSYRFLNTTAGEMELQHQTTDYIYLRKRIKEKK